MSTCAYIIRNYEAPDSVKRALIDCVNANGYGLVWHIPEPGLAENGIAGQNDFVVSVCDSFEYDSCDTVLDRDDQLYYAWKEPHVRLPERMHLLERIAGLLIPCTGSVELVICGDNATPSDLIQVNIQCNQVAGRLLQEYDNLSKPVYNPVLDTYVIDTGSIPSLHLFIHF